MDFFTQFFRWLDGQLLTYVSDKTELAALAIEPVAVILGSIYVMLWGLVSIRGLIQEPVMEGVKRILVVALILGVGIKLWSYNSLITDTFYNGPDQFAARLVGAQSTVSIVDRVWIDGNLVAEELLKKGSILSGDFAYYLAGFFVYFLVGLTVVYTAFLLALSKIAISVVLAIGPIFILLLFFEPTKRFFESWVAQLANYAIVTILTLLTAALMLNVVKAYAENAVALGSGVTIAESVRLCIASVLIFLVMRQVLSISAGLASGIALSSFGAVSGLMRWGLGVTKRTGYDFGRGIMDGWRGEPFSHWDSLRRGLGNRVGAGLGATRDAAMHKRPGGRLVPRERYYPPRNHNL